MESSYKIWGQDVGNLLEFFTSDEQNTYTVADSQFTNGDEAYKKGGVDLKTAFGGTFPTSAGADYPGGYNLMPSYKTNGVSMDVALKGCRPIGVPLKDVGAGSYVIYRSDNKTYFTCFLNYKVLVAAVGVLKTFIREVEEPQELICLVA